MKPRKTLWRILWILPLFLSVLAICSALWYTQKYGDTGFMSILSTFLSPWDGCANSLLESFLCYALLPAVTISVVFSFLLLWGNLSIRKEEKSKTRCIPWNISRWIFALASVICLSTAAYMVHFPAYIYDNYFTHSQIYEEEYVDPKEVEIRFPDKKRNLIYIFLESMETSFLSKELGGGSEVNLIPELYDLAKENINFSHNEGIGGWPRITHTTWTSAAMVAQSAGVPLTIDIPQIDLSNFRGYLPGATTINDILHDAGYYQSLMVGSDASFGGRKEYFREHGVDRVYDLYTAREDGLIPEDYMVWWGYEDAKLFDYAKRELSQISNQDQPFAFTLLTVDTHHIDGYFCQYCHSDHEEQYENVISCSSKQVLEFVKWIQEQDFYDNTTIVICGDHPSMDNQYFSKHIEKDNERHNYNCIINSSIPAHNQKNRDFTPMDLFPTTLAALGCEIEGERLGLGTNLFSDVPTLAERIGFKVLNRELSKRSTYYNTQLIPE